MRAFIAALPVALGLLGTAVGTESHAVSVEAVYAGIPVTLSPEYPITVLDKGFYTVGYSEDFENPAWVFYHIGPATELKSFKRPKFATDTETTSRVRHADYTNTDFDRGHMAPNHALGSRFGAAGAKSTFVMSNVCPQYHDFNDGQWGDLEEWIAGKKGAGESFDNFMTGWADEFEEIWVVVGPIFDEEREPMKPSDIPVPSAFYCVVVDEEEGQPRALAFIMPHVNERVDDLAQFLTSIDEVERRAELDFFAELPDEVEKKMERTKAAGLWELPRSPN